MTQRFQRILVLMVALFLWATPLWASPTDPPLAESSPITSPVVEQTTGYPPMDTSGLEQIETTHLDVWTVPDAKKAMARLAIDVEDDLKRIRGYLGVQKKERIRVVVLENINDYFKRRGEQPRAPNWAVGLALSSESTVLVMWGRSAGGRWVDLKATLVHELAHIALERSVGESLGHVHGQGHMRVDVTKESTKNRRVPRWLHEGFAIWAAGEWNLERSQTLIEAGIGGNIIPLTHLRNGFPPEGPSVQLAYAESYNFLQHLHERFGGEPFQIMIGNMREGNTFEKAFETAYSRSFGIEESAWRQDMKMSYGWLPTVFGSTAVLAFGGIMLTIAWRRRRTQIKARMEQMAQSEHPADILPPLPGFGLTEMDVRPRPWRVLGDGSVLPRGSEVQLLHIDEEDDEGFFPEDEIIIGDDGIPRTSEGFTIH